jgi:hypothetical protein
MNAKRILALTLTLAAVLLSSLATPPAASASPRISLGIRVGAPPPPLRHEMVVVRPGPHHVWVPGYWDWAPARHDYVWVGGRWVRPRHRHAVWVGPRWERRGHETFYIRGHWRG